MTSQVVAQSSEPVSMTGHCKCRSMVLAVASYPPFGPGRGVRCSYCVDVSVKASVAKRSAAYHSNSQQP